MCGRFTLRKPSNVLIQHFLIDAGLIKGQRYNVSPTQDVLTIRSVDGKRQPAMMRWGLIPSWADDPKIGYRMINARSEEAATKASFRGPMKSRRCLIAADGFYEWAKVGKAKQPYHFTLASGEPFAFAGLWERWSKGKGEPIESCTIITCEPWEPI